MKQYINTGVDKLTLCYKIDKNSLLYDINEEDMVIDLGDFRLHRIKSGHFKNAFKIITLWDAPDGNGLSWQNYGILKFCRYTDSGEKAQLAWIYYDNPTLYKQVYPNVNASIYGEFISERLCLELKNITEIEIYFDTTQNAPKAIKHMLRNTNITTLLNGRVVERKTNINEILYLHKGTLNTYKDMSIYVKQSDKEGFQLKSYDKHKEITESSHKAYIQKWHQLDPTQKLYRVEISLKHRHIREYITNNRIELTHNLFSDREFLFNCFLHFSNRLLRFRNKDNTTYSILEVI